MIKTHTTKEDWYDLRYKFRKSSKDKLIQFVLDLIIDKVEKLDIDEQARHNIYNKYTYEFLELLDETKKFYLQYPDFC